MTLAVSHTPSLSLSLPRFGAAFRRAIHSMQYARMCEALGQMSDESLAATGITRADIPRRAHECVYGNGDTNGSI